MCGYPCFVSVWPSQFLYFCHVAWLCHPHLTPLIVISDQDVHLHYLIIYYSFPQYGNGNPITSPASPSHVFPVFKTFPVCWK